MNDKEMIEEMAKDICKACETRHNCDKELCCMSEIVAKELVERGYRKIPQDRVVLTMEEYEKGKQDYNYQIHRALVAEGRVDKASKETAKKIWGEASLKAYNKNENPLKREIYVVDMEDLRDIVNEVGVEIKE